ncbi:MAG TPA: efflux RND transporter periplasmic adaptor subunit [Paracoccus solventivorans]|uniref:Efflux RND transporter periplasmic adaptor subunit n=1 Tax=Paracoccus solventivorans TaxID=53463 RepID=A0A832PKJ0_9RHOB|nr:efflux RND transporter periplasmic adaptor subunit [Paracoccus solventivorans]HHW32720.1 efflux RND transporter periplasmic adaptor subunit [Paracoccus solventivorans]
MRPLLIAVLVAAASAVSAAETLLLAPQDIPQWKAVYGRVEARDLVPARARIGGTVVELSVSEGDSVAAGTQIALVRDDKISFQIAAIDAQLRALGAQLERAQAELTRGRSLVERGVSTAQRLEQLETDVSVTQNQIAAAQAQRDVALQQAEEGEVLAPVDGRVLTVPVTRDAVIMGGEPVATIAGGGFFLRLAIPERHAPDLREGAELQITSNGSVMPGRLAKLYPQIENGRVIADVEVEGLDASFVDARVLVRVPVGVRRALLVPQAALSSHSGLDFVRIRQGDAEVERAVVPGEVLERDGTALVEILTGLHAGDTVLLP